MIRSGIAPIRAWWLEESSSGLGPGEVPDPFVRPTNEDAPIAVQYAARVIPPGHELYVQWLQGWFS